MRRTKFLVGIVSILASAAAFAHATMDHQAPMTVAGNGGLAWFTAGNGGLAWAQFLLFNAGF